jgi:hypothetical protein
MMSRRFSSATPPARDVEGVKSYTHVNTVTARRLEGMTGHSNFVIPTMR